MSFGRNGCLGAIFDFDGVLVNTVPIHFAAWKRMFAEFGKEFTYDDYKEKVDGIPRLEGARAILGELPFEELQKACDKKQQYFAEILEQEKVEVFEDTLQLIKELKARGIKIALISSSKNAADIVKKLRLEELFDTTVLGEAGIKPKPDPQIFMEAALRLGVNPSSCVVFEDAKLGVEAAKRAGMRCVGIHRGVNPKALENADVLLHDLSQFTVESLEELLGQNQFKIRPDFFPLSEDDDWLIVEQGFDAKNQKNQESIFALGNGYFGRRGQLEESPKGCFPGTYIAGVFDKSQAQVTQLVNIPNPVHFRIYVGEKYLTPRNATEHYRALDMKNGFLVRKTVFNSKTFGRIAYSSLIFLSMQDKNVGVLRVFLTPLDKNVVLTVKDRIDGSVVNYDAAQRKDIRHLDIVDLGESEGICYLIAETKDQKIPIAVASHLDAAFESQKENENSVLETTYRIHPDKATRELKIEVKKGDTICLTKIFYVKHFAPSAGLKSVRRRILAAARRTIAQRYERLLKRHIEAWKEKWEEADIEIKGDPYAQKAVRFNIYHLLICGNETSHEASIGARSLTGEGYSGHVFWDTEIYILPFFIYTNPVVAKNLLIYRYLRLDEARNKAKEYGFEGALFPWESADSGKEVTPRWAKGNFGRIVRILTGEQQHHIVSDIAYAVMNYWRATKDTAFMKQYGLELIFETARFWKSRVAYNKNLDRYEIRQVIGPDEFHEGVHNNAYTNLMAAWNLRFARELFIDFSRISPETIERLRGTINITEEEVINWGQIADKIHIPRKNALLEAHDGYFNREDLVFDMDTHSFPIFPREIPSFTRLQKTQLVKQADVVLLLYLLGNLFSKEEKKENFDYYEKRTLHSSSLSCAIHSIVASLIGYPEKAYQYFRHSALLDLENIQNTGNGIHIGACGGTWQAIIFGFAGLKFYGDKFILEPHLPIHWKSVSFKLRWHGYTFSCRVISQGNEIIRLKGS